MISAHDSGFSSILTAFKMSVFKESNGALVDESGAVVLRYEDLSDSSDSYNFGPKPDPVISIHDLSDTSDDFDTALRNITNLVDLTSSPPKPMNQLHENEASRPPSAQKPEIERIFSPYFPPKSDGVQSASIPWSSSPEFHKIETIQSMRAAPSVSRAFRPHSSSKINHMDSSPTMDKLPGFSSARTHFESGSPVRNGSQDKSCLSQLGIKHYSTSSKKSNPTKSNAFYSGNSLKKDLGISSKTASRQASSSASKLARPSKSAISVDNSSSQDIDVAQAPSSSSHKPTADAPIARLFLSKEQLKVLDVVVREERSVFFTGAAGTGKSILLQRIIADLIAKYTRRCVGVTASTGLASLNIGGTTLHSFTGIGLGKEEPKDLVKKIRRNRKKLARWKALKVLIVDEISMIDGNLFDKLEEVARIIRKNSEPFGGIQLVVTGDFFQLPPIAKDSNLKFAFEADCWNSTISHTIVLEQVFRQKDPTFSEMLNDMRRGILKPESITVFKSLSRTPNLPKGMQPTELYPRKIHVDKSNERMLKSLEGRSVTFKADDFYSGPEAETMYNLENMMAVTELSLKKGAQVMMIKNIDDTLVNGSTGVVVGFMSESCFNLLHDDPESLEIVLNKSEEESNGNSIIQSTPQIKDDEEDRMSVFGGWPGDEAGEADSNHINWSRKRERLKLLENTEKNVGASWPVVRFFQNDGTTRDVLCQPETWSFEDENGRVIASRSQVPLILAWALSIHKSQGQTLKWLKVDLTWTFEKGQAYVAISRATSMAGLQVIGFQPHKVMVHPKVVEFYDALSNVFNLKDEELLNDIEQRTGTILAEDEEGMTNAEISANAVEQPRTKRTSSRKVTRHGSKKIRTGQGHSSNIIDDFDSDPSYIPSQEYGQAEEGVAQQIFMDDSFEPVLKAPDMVFYSKQLNPETYSSEEKSFIPDSVSQRLQVDSQTYKHNFDMSNTTQNEYAQR